MTEPTRTIKIYEKTHPVLRLLAAMTGETILDLVDRLATQEIKTMYPSTVHTNVRQILHDGEPAIIVTHTRRHYQQRTISDALGTRNAGDHMPLSDEVHTEYLKFPSPRPVELFGRPVVGQWSDKKFNHLRGTIVDNTDPATFIDYDAWVAAFHQVYSES